MIYERKLTYTCGGHVAHIPTDICLSMNFNDDLMVSVEQIDEESILVKDFKNTNNGVKRKLGEISKHYRLNIPVKMAKTMFFDNNNAWVTFEKIDNKTILIKKLEK